MFIALSIFAFALFLFLAFLFWELAEDSDSKILTALFGSLTIVFIFCAGIAALVCIGALFAL